MPENHWTDALIQTLDDAYGVWDADPDEEDVTRDANVVELVLENAYDLGRMDTEVTGSRPHIGAAVSGILLTAGGIGAIAWLAPHAAQTSGALAWAAWGAVFAGQFVTAFGVLLAVSSAFQRRPRKGK